MDEEYSRFLKTVLTDDPAGWKSIVNLDTLYTDPGETLYRLGKFDLTAAGMPVEIGYLDALPHDVAVRHAGAWLSKVISDDAAGYNEHHPGNLDLYFTQSRENFEVLLDRFGADSTKQLLAIARPLVLNDLKGDYPNRYVGAKSELDSLDMELATYQRKYRSPTPLRNLGTLNASARITRFAKGHLLSIFLILSSLIWSLKYSRRVFYRKRTRHRRDNTSGAS